VSNCLLFALNRWIKHGGYIAIRKSRMGPWLHFIWIKDLKDAEIEHYVPENDVLNSGSITKIMFKGKIKDRD